MPTKNMTLEFPAAGIDRRVAFQRESPFTSPQMVNVRPVDTLAGKRRGGSRPYLIKQFATELGTDTGQESAGASSANTFIATANVFRAVQIGAVITMDGSSNTYTITALTDATTVTIAETYAGADDNDTFTVSGVKVNLLNLIRTTNVTGAAQFLDELLSDAQWDTAGFASATADFTATVGLATGPTLTGVTEGNVLKTANIPDMEINTVRTIAMLVESKNDVRYNIFGNMDDTTPDDDDSVQAQLSIQSTGTTVSVLVDKAQVANIQGPVVGSGYFWFSLKIEPSKLTARFEGTSTVEVTHSGTLTPVGGDAAGFTMSRFSNGGVPTIDTFRIDYIADSGPSPPEFILAAANGQLFKEAPAGVMTTVGANITLETDPIQSVARLGRLYIADWAPAPRRERQTLPSGGEASVGASGALDDTSVSDWTTLTTTDGSGEQIVIGGDVVEILASAGGTPIATGFYKVSAVASGNITITELDDTAVTDIATNISYRIIPGLKVYDSSTDAVTFWKATTGVLPYGTRIISSFQDRIVLTGDPQYSGQWWMGEQGNPDGWLESTTVISAVFGGATDVNTKLNFGAPIRAAVKFTKDYHIMGTINDMWIFRGDPRLGGGLDRISDNIGILDLFAWTMTDDNRLFFLTRTGLFVLSEQDAAVLEEPKSVSRERIPLELRNIDVDTFATFMKYDANRNGFWIWAVPLTEGAPKLWFFSLNTNGFLQDTLESEHDPFSTVFSTAINDTLIGCRDGFIRRFDDAATSDDGNAQTAVVDIGPFRLDGGLSTMAESFEAVLSPGSDTVNWNFRVGQTAEEVFSASVAVSGTLTAGLSYRQTIRRWGEWGMFQLNTTAAAQWSLEALRLRVMRGGPSRRVNS